jgi:FAD/FMN-containing dehydrogenase
MRGELLLRDLLERHGAGPPAEPARSAGPATAGGSAAERAGGSNSDAIPPN